MGRMADPSEYALEQGQGVVFPAVAACFGELVIARGLLYVFLA